MKKLVSWLCYYESRIYTLLHFLEQLGKKKRKKSRKVQLLSRIFFQLNSYLLSEIQGCLTTYLHEILQNIFHFLENYSTHIHQLWWCEIFIVFLYKYTGAEGLEINREWKMRSSLCLSEAVFLGATIEIRIKLKKNSTYSLL